MTLPTLSVPRNYADNKPWNKARVDEVVSSIESWAAQISSNGLDATAAVLQTNTITRSDGDVWTIPDLGSTSFVGLAGAQTITGSKTFSGANTLILPTTAPTVDASVAVVSKVLQTYNSTTSRADAYLRTDTYNETVYSAANINLTTANDGAYTDVDATNAAITFTVGVPGRYLISFSFTYEAVGSGVGVVLGSQTYFRLTDGTNNSSGVMVDYNVDSDAGATPFFDTPVYLDTVFNYATTGSKTVTLQRRNTTSTGFGTRIINCNNTNSVALVMKAYRIAD